jgi:hypothetical protein
MISRSIGTIAVDRRPNLHLDKGTEKDIILQCFYKNRRLIVLRNRVRRKGYVHNINIIQFLIDGKKAWFCHGCQKGEVAIFMRKEEDGYG